MTAKTVWMFDALEHQCLIVIDIVHFYQMQWYIGSSSLNTIKYGDQSVIVPVNASIIRPIQHCTVIYFTIGPQEMLLHK